ncbi:MAG: ABC transporter ATP-binding protein, partial [Bacteroidetes bacterium]|nr:ABC transporter ATP-binding protein [Bacteroidota bacterium]
MLLSLIRPTSGSIRIFGRSLAEDRREILRSIGCIIEKPDFYLYLSARRNLELFARMSMVQPTARKVEEMFELVGLRGRENDPVRTYSHGMKQRLGLAQALIHDPRLVILDEPTTGLDPQGIIDLRHLILRMKNEMGKTVILSSHILSEMELIADSMAIISKGKAIAQGKVSQLLSDDDLLVYIEPVDMEALRTIITTSVWADAIDGLDAAELRLRISKAALPALHAHLEQHGVQLYSLYYRKRLEDYFLKLTNA